MQLKNIDKGNFFDFGRISDDYAKYRDIYPESMYEKLISFGIGRPGQNILDLGSGTAVLPLNLAHTGASFTASDISENQISSAKQLAAERGIGNIDFRVCSAENTGFADSSFDAVISTDTCYFWNEPQRVLAEIRRILVPSGRLILAYNAMYAASVHRSLGTDMYSDDSIRAALEKAGMEIISAGKCGFEQRVFSLSE